MAMATARCPADRPMAVTRYQRLVVLASASRFLSSSAPQYLAVSKPNVGASRGSGRSLSMVLGTWTARMLPPAVAATFTALEAVSSPPRVTRSVTSSLASAATTASRSSWRLVGLARAV